ncbi:glycosyltransferase family 2 protein [Phascolarctobacterium sp.]|uniref:glycosyltransferase family 2 protein n=1 Tax=Phascolarctobacterium sp. TaxID=2049039 RepID=UPI003060EE31
MGNLVSIIVPVYNVEKYIHKAIDSILNQTYKNIEIILIDDGSPDNCPAICDAYATQDHRVKVVHQQNSGLAASRMKGIAFARGEYILFIDSDDWIEPAMVEDMLLAAEKNSADIVVCDYKIFAGDKEENGEVQQQSLDNSWTAEKFRDEFLFDNYANFMCNKLYRIKLLRGTTIPDIIFEDLYVNAGLFAKCSKVYYVENSYYCYRVHASFTNMTQKTRRKYGLFMAWREHERVCREYDCPPLAYSGERARKAAVSLLVINEYTNYLSTEQKADVEMYLRDNEQDIARLPFKYRMQWCFFKYMRALCVVCGSISICFDNFKRWKYKK